MHRQKETRPSLQAKGRAHKCNAIVSQPRPVSREDLRFVFATTIAVGAFTVWIEAGFMLAILYIAVVAPILKLYEVIIS